MLILNYFSHWSSVSIAECEQVVACDSKILLVNMNKPLHNGHIEKKTNFSVNVNKFTFTQNFVLLAWYHKEQSQFVQTSIPYGPLKKPLYESKSPKICGEHI